jgi:hypothetical protein
MVTVLIHKRGVTGCRRCALYDEKFSCVNDVTRRYLNYHGGGAPCAANVEDVRIDIGVLNVAPPDERRSEAMQLIWLASKD